MTVHSTLHMRIWDTTGSPVKHSCISTSSLCRNLSPALRVGLGPSAACCFIVLLQENLYEREGDSEIFSCLVLRLCPFVPKMTSSASGPFPLLCAGRVLSEEATEHKEAKLLFFSEEDDQRDKKPCRSPLPHQFGVTVFEQRPLQPHSAPYKHISTFLSTRRSSQCISGLLLLSCNHIILSDPCYSIHALQTFETLVAYFYSRGSGLMHHLGH